MASRGDVHPRFKVRELVTRLGYNGRKGELDEQSSGWLHGGRGRGFKAARDAQSAAGGWISATACTAASPAAAADSGAADDVEDSRLENEGQNRRKQPAESRANPRTSLFAIRWRHVGSPRSLALCA